MHDADHGAASASGPMVRRRRVISSEDHALMTYGGEYAKDGAPLLYWIKDSLEPYTYHAGSETIHRELNDVTAAVDRLAVEPQQVP